MHAWKIDCRSSMPEMLNQPTGVLCRSSSSQLQSMATPNYLPKSSPTTWQALLADVRACVTMQHVVTMQHCSMQRDCTSMEHAIHNAYTPLVQHFQPQAPRSVPAPVVALSGLKLVEHPDPFRAQLRRVGQTPVRCGRAALPLAIPTAERRRMLVPP